MSNKNLLLLICPTGIILKDKLLNVKMMENFHVNFSRLHQLISSFFNFTYTTWVNNLMTENFNSAYFKVFVGNVFKIEKNNAKS